ncbi:four helix bundle protein [candidate division KSB1 bacterium]|nr:MAG: four helix bundle protein [candidate division KSB1 bacterium]
MGYRRSTRKKGFREIRIWQKARDLATYIYKITDSPSFKKDYGLRNQIRRAAVSIPSNIAEGDKRDTNKESVRFLYIANGSLAELLTQFEISKAIGYISNDEFEYIELLIFA